MAESKEAVALELMGHIARTEQKETGSLRPGDRDYVLRLYSECLRVVAGGTDYLEVKPLS